MEVTAENGRVAMKPTRPVDTDDTLTATDAKRVRHAMQQLTSGKNRPWSKVKRDLGL